MDIRPATTEEHDKVLKVMKTSKHTGAFGNRPMFSNDDMYAKGWIVVAEIDGLLVGAYCVRQSVRFKETVLYFITIDTKQRSKGIGLKLMEDMKEQSPFNRIRLNVADDNPRARQFYEQMGFEEETEGQKPKGTARLALEFVK